MKIFIVITKGYDRIWVDLCHSHYANSNLETIKTKSKYLEKFVPFSKFQKILQEPLKFLKDPTWNFLALEALKDPSTEIFIRIITNYIVRGTVKISKESIEDISYESYAEYYHKFLKEP